MIVHQPNSMLLANSIRILNTIIDGSSRQTQTNRSTSLYNLSNSSSTKFSFISSNGSKLSSSISLTTLPTPRSTRTLTSMSGNRSPLWTALTTAQTISDYADYDSWHPKENGYDEYDEIESIEEVWFFTHIVVKFMYFECMISNHNRCIILMNRILIPDLLYGGIVVRLWRWPSVSFNFSLSVYSMKLLAKILVVFPKFSIEL